MTVDVTWLGHSAWQLQIGEALLLVDPFLTGNPAAAATANRVQPQFLFVSHGHADHVGDAAEIAMRTGALVIANYEITEWLARQGVANVHPMNTGGGHRFPIGYLKLTIAHHTSMLPDGSNGGSPCGMLLTLEDGRRIYHAADTGLFYDMKLIGDEGVDLAILPIGDNFTMGPDDALRAVELIRPKVVIPTHYNTWPVIAQDPHAWAQRVRGQRIAEPIVLAPGQTFRF
jgi:L-ascorbate metabolism protein UlaG (beta-lactamase superfamily)